MIGRVTYERNYAVDHQAQERAGQKEDPMKGYDMDSPRVKNMLWQTMQRFKALSSQMAECESCGEDIIDDIHSALCAACRPDQAMYSDPEDISEDESEGEQMNIYANHNDECICESCGDTINNVKHSDICEHCEPDQGMYSDTHITTDNNSEEDTLHHKERKNSNTSAQLPEGFQQYAHLKKTIENKANSQNMDTQTPRPKRKRTSDTQDTETHGPLSVRAKKEPQEGKTIRNNMPMMYARDKREVSDEEVGNTQYGENTGPHPKGRVRTRQDKGPQAMEGIWWGNERKLKRGYLHYPVECVVPDLYLDVARWLPYIMSDGTIVIRRGLFTSKPIKKGQIITTYAGMGKYVDRDTVGTAVAAYYMTLMKGTNKGSIYVIDGIREPKIGYGFGSFANDRRDPKLNNAEKIVVSSIGSRGQDKQMGIYIKATCYIPAGTEITYSYGEDYFGDSEPTDKEPWMIEQEYMARTGKAPAPRREDDMQQYENPYTHEDNHTSAPSKATKPVTHEQKKEKEVIETPLDKASQNTDATTPNCNVVNTTSTTQEPESHTPKEENKEVQTRVIVNKRKTPDKKTTQTNWWARPGNARRQLKIQA
jgi:hypothetical protein